MVGERGQQLAGAEEAGAEVSAGVGDELGESRGGERAVLGSEELEREAARVVRLRLDRRGGPEP